MKNNKYYLLHYNESPINASDKALLFLYKTALITDFDNGILPSDKDLITFIPFSINQVFDGV